jgi:cob(I)alamin adenosyltransferase
MEQKIQSALDWPEVRNELRAALSKISYNHDLYKMLSNIDNMITELSKAEVTARQRKNDNIVTTKIKSINESIQYVEKMLLYFALAN